MEEMLQQKAKVLIVDDSQESVDLLVYFLKPAGYDLGIANDGAAAIEEVEKNPPDIILLDIMLPKINGYEVCEKLKKNRETFHIPIIMITALKELKDKIRALEAGADDFISKPFDNVELVTRVKSLLRIKFYHDELLKRNRELQRQKEALMREDMLKKELSNLIVHDMKNPLFVIQGNLQMMEINQKAPVPQSSEIYTQRIARSSRSLLRMILNLLDISRLEQKKMEIEPVPFNLNAMIEDIVGSFKDIPEHQSKTVDMKCHDDQVSIYADKDVFERVLDNLFNFVFQNTPDFMAISVETESMEDHRIRLVVSHEGYAIPNKFKRKIFLKTAQPELRKSGFKPARGLGLLFCRLAMEAQQGTIFLRENCTEKNCFVLEIPTFEYLKRDNP
ncbi:MAG: hybrid sensor histidine kinase/response regulator [Calditrichia bacterium]